MVEISFAISFIYFLLDVTTTVNPQYLHLLFCGHTLHENLVGSFDHALHISSCLTIKILLSFPYAFVSIYDKNKIVMQTREKKLKITAIASLDLFWSEFADMTNSATDNESM